MLELTPVFTEFGNFIAGYSGVHFGVGGYTGVRIGGILFDYVDGAKNWDLDSVMDIEAGAELARQELKGWMMPPCKPKPKKCDIPSTTQAAPAGSSD